MMRDPGPALILRCVGSSEQFRRLGIFGERFAFPIRPQAFIYALAYGYMDLDKNGKGTLGIYLCKPVTDLAIVNGVELASCGDFDIFHGTQDELMPFVEKVGASFPRKMPRKYGGYMREGIVLGWEIRPIPDGTYIFIVENGAALKRKAEKCAHKAQRAATSQDKRYESVEHFRDALCQPVDIAMEAILERGAGDGKMWLPESARQHIIGLREQLKHYLSTTNISIAQEGDRPRAALRLVVSNGQRLCDA